MRQFWGDLGETPCSESFPPGPLPFTRDDDADAPDGLARFIERDVVPGLVLAHRVAPLNAPAHEAPTAETIEAFATLVLADDASAISEFVDRLHGAGASVENLYLGLLSGAARRLGDLWDADIVDFTAVTIGLWRLQELLRGYSASFQAEGSKPANGHRALMLSPLGEQHNFGLAMLGEFLFREGWSIAGGPGLSLDEIGRLVADQFFAVVAISLSSERGLDAVTTMIELVRRKSRNRGVAVMVGGGVFLLRPELVALVGADSTAPDARQGALQAAKFVNMIEVVG